MQLDSRKLRILQAIIDEYILSAAPVGSRAISKREGFHLSSATIRNEMADLEELGYLEQPHTSAGRIPSDKAYRLYVDNIMHRAQLSEDEIRFIRGQLSSRMDELDSVMKQTAQALSAVTQYTAIVMPPQFSMNRLRHIQLVPLTEGRALVVVVTDTGFAKDTIIRVPEDMTRSELERISNLITERCQGLRMEQVSEAITRELNEHFRARKDFICNMLDTLERRMASNMGGLECSGATNMLTYPEYADMQKAKSFLTAVEGRDTLYHLLKRASNLEFSITIGQENEHEDLKDCSIVTATYRAGDYASGTFGIIGPTRMQYAKVISVLEFMRKSLSEVLTNYIEEE